MKIYTEYEQRIRECFAQAYKFLNEHKHARTQTDWNRIVDSLESYIDPLTVDLIVAVVSELEREYKNYEKIAKD